MGGRGAKMSKNCSRSGKYRGRRRVMRAGGKILGGILRDLKEYVKPGMTGERGGCLGAGGN